MPFTITTTYTGVHAANTVGEGNDQKTPKFAVAQIKTTRSALLYGIEVSCQSGFDSDPEADIYVFNNPRAAKNFVDGISSTFDWKKGYCTNDARVTDSDSLKGYNLGTAVFDDAIPGAYVVTYGRAPFDSNFTGMPLSIAGCRYSDHPKPFSTKTEPGYGRDSTYLTVVVVFNQGDQVEDDNTLIRGIFENA